MSRVENLIEATQNNIYTTHTKLISLLREYFDKTGARGPSSYYKFRQHLFGRFLSLRCQTSDISEARPLPINQAGMGCDPIIPHNNGARPPLNAALNILAQCYMLV